MAGLRCWRDVEGAWRSWPEPSDGTERTFNCCDGGMEGLAGSVQLQKSPILILRNALCFLQRP